MTVAFTFPGQGSQDVGMGAELAEKYPVAKNVFTQVDEALGENLSKIMWEGPKEELTLTANTQPALMAVSMAVMKVLELEKGLNLAEKANCVAGHSLGEYSALAAAGTFSIEDTAKLLKIRGTAMQEAVPVGEGAMAALLGLDFDVAKEVAEEAAKGEVCQAANDNAPGQVVISGAKSAVERAIPIAQDRGARRAILLPVSAPFHCSLMQPAAEKMAEALETVDINIPSVPLVCNVLAEKISDTSEIKKRLVEQVTGVVRWRESIEYMANNGIETLFEIGSGKVLTGLARRIAPSLNAKPAGKPDEIDAMWDILA